VAAHRRARLSCPRFVGRSSRSSHHRTSRLQKDDAHRKYVCPAWHCLEAAVRPGGAHESSCPVSSVGLVKIFELISSRTSAGVFGCRASRLTPCGTRILTFPERCSSSRRSISKSLAVPSRSRALLSIVMLPVNPVDDAACLTPFRLGRLFPAACLPSAYPTKTKGQPITANPLMLMVPRDGLPQLSNFKHLRTSATTNQCTFLWGFAAVICRTFDCSPISRPCS
jgi:hypothetical protein